MSYRTARQMSVAFVVLYGLSVAVLVDLGLTRLAGRSVGAMLFFGGIAVGLRRVLS